MPLSNPFDIACDSASEPGGKAQPAARGRRTAPHGSIFDAFQNLAAQTGAQTAGNAGISLSEIFTSLF
jgi:hypothetical protein